MVQPFALGTPLRLPQLEGEYPVRLVAYLTDVAFLQAILAPVKVLV